MGHGQTDRAVSGDAVVMAEAVPEIAPKGPKMPGFIDLYRATDLMQEAALSWDVPLERLSFQGAVDGARHFGEALLRARTQRQRTALYAELLRILAADEVPDRPGRHEPRAVKRRLKAYARLNCERKKFREVSHRNRRLSARAKARENRAAI